MQPVKVRAASELLTLQSKSVIDPHPVTFSEVRVLDEQLIVVNAVQFEQSKYPKALLLTSIVLRIGKLCNPTIALRFPDPENAIDETVGRCAVA